MQYMFMKGFGYKQLFRQDDDEKCGIPDKVVDKGTVVSSMGVL